MQAPKYFLAILLSFTFLMGCKNDDDSPKIKFSAEQLKMVYGDSQKSWRVTAHYDNYAYTQFSAFNDCYKDDIYTFKAETEEVEVTLGSLGCYWASPDEQVATVSYFYVEDEGRFYLEHGRGEGSGVHFASKFFILELEEISETRLLFAAGEKGRYSKALILETVN
ncbi:hypothetical protein OB69_12150 [Roseivirga seohaensis subsp. aquiponti]|uniref:Lipocalin-like domain-containing protein n=1 Tax=Roseivirga seohaensis subsp. aquiponti TaxID=1566026 RepID=A0A0L8AJV8_9BACT|nr:hypothetical protein [Roseivirga seohaensis]KOF02516.1 hypothetical protein OB69_12150 [Roseivirga seohaensis subsp. aquiponti]